jgi:hypothetical protein
MALVWRVACDTFLMVLAGSRQCTKEEPRPPESIVGDDRERRVVSLLRQAQQCFSKLSRHVQLWSYTIKLPKAKQDWGEFWRLAHLLAQFARPGVCAFHLRCCEPFRHLQGRAESDVQGQGVLGMRGRLWQSSEQLDPSGEVADGFRIGRAFTGLLARPLPVANGLLCESSLSIVMGQQLGLRLTDVGKLCL